MNNKNLVQTLVSAVAIVWIFCISLVVSLKVAENKREAATTAPIQTQTTASTTQTTTETTTGTTMKRNPVVGNNVSVAVSVGDPDWLIAEESSKAAEASKKAEEESKKAAEAKSTTAVTTTKPASIVPESKADIINAYITGVNKLKKEQNFTLTVTDELNITIDEITGGSAVQSLADSLMAQNVNEPITYNFANGLDSATSSTPTAVIAPLNRDASVNNDAVLTAEATPVAGGGYKVKLTLIDELQTTTAPAPNHVTTVEVVDVEPLLPAGVTISTLNITYTGTIIEATFNSENKIVSMRHYLCVKECDGSGTFTIFPVTVKIHGDFISQYDVTY